LARGKEKKRKPVVYVETSVASYYTARPSRDIIILARQEITRQWWEFASQSCHLVISEAVVLEVNQGDPLAASKRAEAIRELPRLPSSLRTEQVTEHYLRELLLPAKAGGDAAHLAVASVHGVDYLVTWNCAHLANESVRRSLARINDSLGLATPIILTPEEMLETLK